MSILVIIGLISIAFGALGWYIAAAKGRPDPEGLILGLLFGPLGCLIEALLPNASKRDSDPNRIPAHERRSGRRGPGLLDCEPRITVDLDAIADADEERKRRRDEARRSIGR